MRLLAVTGSSSWPRSSAMNWLGCVASPTASGTVSVKEPPTASAPKSQVRVGATKAQLLGTVGASQVGRLNESSDADDACGPRLRIVNVGDTDVPSGSKGGSAL